MSVPPQSEQRTTTVIPGFSPSHSHSSERSCSASSSSNSTVDSVATSLSQTKQQTLSEPKDVVTQTIKVEKPDDDVFESDDVDESAIDDSSDWEDLVEDSGDASIDEKNIDKKNLFQRIDSRPNPTSRQSLITTMVRQNFRANAHASAALASRSTPALQRSRTTSPNGPSLAASPDSKALSLIMKDDLKPIGNADVPEPGARPIVKTTTNMTPHQLALSPCTTRRNMLATELTVSLRQHLLWERQQKSQTANAVLKRRHTAHDVTNLKQFPEKVYMKWEDQDAQSSSWDEYFDHKRGRYYNPKLW